MFGFLLVGHGAVWSVTIVLFGSNSIWSDWKKLRRSLFHVNTLQIVFSLLFFCVNLLFVRKYFVLFNTCLSESSTINECVNHWFYHSRFLFDRTYDVSDTSKWLANANSWHRKWIWSLGSLYRTENEESQNMARRIFSSACDTELGRHDHRSSRHRTSVPFGRHVWSLLGNTKSMLFSIQVSRRSVVAVDASEQTLLSHLAQTWKRIWNGSISDHRRRQSHWSATSSSAELCCSRSNDEEQTQISRSSDPSTSVCVYVRSLGICTATTRS